MTAKNKFPFIRTRLAQCFDQKFQHSGWKSMAEDIQNLTGLEIRAESLRQAIRPTSKISGLPARVPKDELVCSSLAEYATKTGYITQAELDGYSTLGLLPEALITFLSGRKKIETQHQQHLNGTYTGHWTLGRLSESITLHVDFETPQQAIRATAIHSRDYDGGIDEDDPATVFQGFLGSDQNDFAMIILHNDVLNENLCLLIVQTIPPLRLKESPSSIAATLYQGAIGSTINHRNLPSSTSLLLTRTSEAPIAEDRKESDRPKRRHLVALDQTLSGMEELDQLGVDDRFLELCRNRLFGQAAKLIPYVDDINRLHPELKVNALHLAASMSARQFIEKLKTREDIDFLCKDGRGYFAFDIAALDGLDQALSSELYKLASAAADADTNKTLPPYSP